MAALRSLTADDRAEIERDLAKARADHQALRFRLSELEACQAPRSFRGKIRYQLSVQARWIARYEAQLAEVAA